LDLLTNRRGALERGGKPKGIHGIEGGSFSLGCAG